MVPKKGRNIHCPSAPVVLQCVTVRCSVLQCVAVCCSVLSTQPGNTLSNSPYCVSVVSLFGCAMGEGGVGQPPKKKKREIHRSVAPIACW